MLLNPTQSFSNVLSIFQIIIRSIANGGISIQIGTGTNAIVYHHGGIGSAGGVSAGQMLGDCGGGGAIPGHFHHFG